CRSAAEPPRASLPIARAWFANSGQRRAFARSRDRVCRPFARFRLRERGSELAYECGSTAHRRQKTDSARAKAPAAPSTNTPECRRGRPVRRASCLLPIAEIAQKAGRRVKQFRQVVSVADRVEVGMAGLDQGQRG